jgi:hypothetical protein
VRLTFNLYLELGCVSKFKDRLIELQVRSKAQISKTGRHLGECATHAERFARF